MDKDQVARITFGKNEYVVRFNELGYLGGYLIRDGKENLRVESSINDRNDTEEVDIQFGRIAEYLLSWDREYGSTYGGSDKEADRTGSDAVLQQP